MNQAPETISVAAPKGESRPADDLNLQREKQMIETDANQRTIDAKDLNTTNNIQPHLDLRIRTPFKEVGTFFAKVAILKQMGMDSDSHCGGHVEGTL